MATSGSTDFSVTTNDIIKRAMRVAGVITQYQNPTNQQYEQHRFDLNAMCKLWALDLPRLWQNTEFSITPVAGTSSYTFGSGGSVTVRALELTSLRWYDGTNDSPRIRLVSRDEYLTIPDKTSSGVPTLAYYELGRDSGTLYIWQVPASGDIPDGTERIKGTYAPTIEDFDNTTDNPDLPQEWIEAMVYNLAVRICPQYKREPPRTVLALAAQAYDIVAGFDRESSVFMGMDYSRAQY